MRTIRFRWYGPIQERPTLGCYLLSQHRPRHGFLITGIVDRGRRGGLGLPTFQLLRLAVEPVPLREAAMAERLYRFTWDRRRSHR